MEFLLQLIATPLVILGMAKMDPKIRVADTRAAVITSIFILLIGFLIGWLITLIFNVLTLGLFWIVGLGIITRTIAYAVVIEIVDGFIKKFKTDGFMPSLKLAVVLAVIWGVIDFMF